MESFRKYPRSETNFTKAVARYLDCLGVLYTHVPNELKTDMKVSSKGQRYSATGAKLKEMGKKAGVPDILIFERRGEFSGMAIELKVGYNKPTDKQQEWQSRLIKNGWYAIWSNSLDEVIEQADRYLKIKKQ